MPFQMNDEPPAGMLRLILTDPHFLLPLGVLLLGVALLCSLQ